MIVAPSTGIDNMPDAESHPAEKGHLKIEPPTPTSRPTSVRTGRHHALEWLGSVYASY